MKTILMAILMLWSVNSMAYPYEYRYVNPNVQQSWSGNSSNYNTQSGQHCFTNCTGSGFSQSCITTCN